MTKINKINIVEAWGYDRLYPILQDAFRVLNISYQKLYAEKQDKPYTRPANVERWFLEDLITDDLIKDEFEFTKEYDYSLIPQYRNIEQRSRIDIAIHWRLAFGKYFNIEIECKLLKKENLNYIIDGGIKKFKSNKYAEKLPLAGMLTYNTSGIISENIKLLNKKIEEKISVQEILKQFNLIDNYQYTYFSNHKRISNSNIDLYTCVFDFKDVIEKSEKSISV